jgi:hypothetical protein
MSFEPKNISTIPTGQGTPDWGYHSTPALPDAEGEALLNKLYRLSFARTFKEPDEKNNRKKLRKVRNGSYEQRWAQAQLEIAMVEASLRFEKHEDFSKWLLGNGAVDLDALDPIRGRDKQSDAIRDLQYQMEGIKLELEYLRDSNKQILELLFRIPRNILSPAKDESVTEEVTP